jgi:hypothetical protein
MSSTYGVIPQKIELKPKKHHGYSVLLFIMGTLFPPLGKATYYLNLHSNLAINSRRREVWHWKGLLD